MEREWVAEESIVVGAAPEAVYAAVSDPRRMPEWSPELFAVWVRGRGRPAGPGTSFTGFNRIGWRVWFTGARVTAAVPGETFAFRVSSFRMPVALWGYRIEDVGDGSGPARTRVTEYWQDLRRDNRGAGLVSLLGRVFTGVPAGRRAEVNRAGMRATLERLKAAVEDPGVTGK
ncbi:SRPBCC family protein [Actinomadura viridis]|uniref:SRPBCC family protein n=1 Tax=Actinomadura viridis TaxID=58110 RepID=UPI0036B556E4